jgi:hypothetical protein
MRHEPGERYGKLTLVERDVEAFRQGKRGHWICRCDCGNVISALTSNVTKGNTTSCGCSRIQHGMAKTKIYSAWRQMRQRCENPKDPAFANYGGRGIKVCDRWQSFDKFYEDMGWPPYGATLDRIDNEGPYSPENCRWASWREQHANKRTNRVLEAFGRTQTLQQWADEYRLPLTTLRNRIDRGGWPVETALTEPVRGG